MKEEKERYGRKEGGRREEEEEAGAVKKNRKLGRRRKTVRQAGGFGRKEGKVGTVGG